MPSLTDTHCFNGHELDETNRRVKDGRVFCRECGRERQRRSRERHGLIGKTPEQRFWANVTKLPDDCERANSDILTQGCYRWTGNISPDTGYGRLGIDYDQDYAHRISYKWFVGPIPDGLQIDHVCRNRWCVNWTHLEPVPRRENLIRGEGFAGQQSRRTHCPKGHPYEGDNLFYSQGKRKCRACVRERNMITWRLRNGWSKELATSLPSSRANQD